MQCEMCGTEGKLFKTEVEGTVMVLCRDCSKFGRVVAEIRPTERVKKIPLNAQDEAQAEKPIAKLQKNARKEIMQGLCSGYQDKIRNRRTELGLKQNELAIKIAEKESIVQKVESGQFRPPIRLARKFERALRIRIVEEMVDEHEKDYKAKKETLTIGDMMDIKKP
ncbi:TIGR00270 family protein [Candidatus Woesearchaeota archaeon]|nr:TIGR00270 family protein [Candidatus Woesearchaeota archaeon]